MQSTIMLGYVLGMSPERSHVFRPAISKAAGADLCETCLASLMMDVSPTGFLPQAGLDSHTFLQSYYRAQWTDAWNPISLYHQINH